MNQDGPSLFIEKIIIFFILKLKFLIDLNQDGPSLIIEASPPPPGPQIAKDVFHIWTYYLLFSLLYLCLQCDEVFMTF